MLKRLRLKIVLAIAGTAFVLLACAYAALLLVTASSARAPIELELKRAVEWGPDQEAVFVIGRQDAARGEGGGSMPVAVVASLADGSVIAYNDAFLGSMDAQTRTRAVEKALASDADGGLLVGEGVFYRRDVVSGGFVLAFIDASAFLTTMSNTAAGMAVVFLFILAVLTALGVALSRAITRPVQRAWDSQAQFVADASHELKTPLTVILANADILAEDEGGLNPEQSKWVGGIRSEARRMRGLVEEMLFLARSDNVARSEHAEAPELDLSLLVREACLTFDAVAFEANVELVESVGDGIAIRADRDQIERLVKSLVDNAIKYAGAAGRVSVTLAERKKGHPTLRVNNTGDPIPPEDLPHVFDRFWRSDKARSASEEASFGLGLAIAKSIAEAQGARIAVSSTAEEGTTFTVSF